MEKQHSVMSKIRNITFPYVIYEIQTQEENTQTASLRTSWYIFIQIPSANSEAQHKLEFGYLRTSRSEHKEISELLSISYANPL